MIATDDYQTYPHFINVASTLGNHWENEANIKIFAQWRRCILVHSCRITWNAIKQITEFINSTPGDINDQTAALLLHRDCLTCASREHELTYF